ncbi:hypothetical protein AVANS_0589 [Campylobacter sp. RM5004]|nr:hypothetical protein AVANS_0589 [Campylobacter sp. RM5004]
MKKVFFLTVFSFSVFASSDAMMSGSQPMMSNENIGSTMGKKSQMMSNSKPMMDKPMMSNKTNTMNDKTMESKPMMQENMDNQSM